MKTIIATFLVSLVFSLLLTPAAKWLGRHFGALDEPSARKVHVRALPRCGGLAIVISFFLAIVAATFLMAKGSDLLVIDRKWALFAAGGMVVFAVGLFDDFHRLGAKVKFLFQIIAASIAFYGGLRIEAFFVAGEIGVQFGILSYFITVFWFLLLINAVNLIDGLDGLAAGVAFFTSFIMVILSLTRPGYSATIEFAALGGAVLGFLRYNFNPASIFMGDGGSYFVGYTIAALAIMGSIKSQVGATLLIPLLALGVPIFDTLLSPVRRFLLGKRMFQPDKEHVHHRLIVMGLTARRSVLIIYGVTFALCAVAIILVNLRNVPAGLLLLLLGLVTIFSVQKLGYLEYLAVDKVYGWLRDIYDVTGLSQDRRSFLAIQIEIDRSPSMDDLWRNICQALETMHIDRGELHLFSQGRVGRTDDEHISDKRRAQVPPSEVSPATGTETYSGPERRRRGTDASDGNGGEDVRREQQAVTPEILPRIWAKGHYRRKEDAYGDGLLRVEIPLCGKKGSWGRLVLIKDLSREATYPYILRRVEFLRRTVTSALERLMVGSNPS